MINKKQAIQDFKYLHDSIDYYLVNEDGLINDVIYRLRRGEMSATDFIVWSIEDLFYFVYSEEGHKIDIEFLEKDKRALRIKTRYGIE